MNTTTNHETGTISMDNAENQETTGTALVIFEQPYTPAALFAPGAAERAERDRIAAEAQAERRIAEQQRHDAEEARRR